MIKWLIALLVGIGAVAAAIFFWRSNRRDASKLWHETVDTTSSWSRTAADKAGEATDNVAETAHTAADSASDAV